MPVLCRHHEHHAVAADTSIVHQIGDVVIGMRSAPDLECTIHFFFFTNIEGHQLGDTASSFNFCLHILCGSGIALVVNDDRQSLRRQFEANSTT